ncbi:MAG: sugar phosphate nucleotidyltransferase, partial [Deltaproteobacteria bacterium]
MFVILAQRTGTTKEKDIRPNGKEIRDGGSLSKTNWSITHLSNVHAVILAGGSGTRFWPLSRETCPKQMLQ